MISSESWPARVSDDQIIERVGQRTFLRGCRYVEQGRVRSVSVSPGGDILTGQVSGSGNRSYQTMVYCNSSDDPRPVWAGSCSCPVGTNCKHTVAVLLTVRRQAVPAPVGAGAGWEGTLTDLLRVSDSGARRPMALEVSQGDSVGWAHRRRGLSLLPLVRGRNGWNRQGASWSQVMGGGLDGDVDDDVLQAVQEIGRMAPRSFYYSDERVDLDDVPRRFWEILRRGVAAGLTLTTAQRGGQPVLVSEGLKAGVSLRIAQDDSLVVAPALNLEDVADLEGRVSDNPPIAGIGSPIHGFVVECLDGGLVLMPIEPAPSEVLARLLADTTRRITVPPSDVPRFKSEYLEPLSRAVPVVIHDPRIDLPEPAALHAVLRVTVDGAAHRARIEWLMRYRAADGRVRLEEMLGDLDAEEAGTGGPPAPPASPPRPALRDMDGERRLAREIVARFTPLAAEHGALWKRRGLSGIDTARFMVRTLPMLKDMEGFETEVVGEAPDYREADGEVLVTTDVDEDADRPDWFSLKVHVKVGDEQAPIARLMAAVASGDKEVLLDSGAWIDLDRPEIRRLADLMAEGRALAEPDPKDPDALRVTAFQAGYYAELVALGVVGRAAQRWRENVERLLALRPLAAGQDDGEGGEQRTVDVLGDLAGVQARGGHGRQGGLAVVEVPSRGEVVEFSGLAERAVHPRIPEGLVDGRALGRRCPLACAERGQGVVDPHLERECVGAGLGEGDVVAGSGECTRGVLTGMGLVGHAPEGDDEHDVQDEGDDGQSAPPPPGGSAEAPEELVRGRLGGLGGGP